MASDACTKCDVCIKKCPVEAIVTFQKRPFWTYRCESCMRCVNICPHRAIETTHTYTGLIFFISSAFISPLLLSGLKKIGAVDWIYHSLLTEKLWSILDAFFFLAFVIICYGIMHMLMRFKFVSRIIAYTSLSKYKFWRRYKSPNF